MALGPETLARLRDVLARELETINQYELYAGAETDPGARTLFQHLANEEKEHVVEVYEALMEHDDAQRAWADSPHARAIREHRIGDLQQPAAPIAPSPSPGPGPGAPPAPFRPGLTVGSLLGRPQD